MDGKGSNNNSHIQSARLTAAAAKLPEAGGVLLGAGFSTSTCASPGMVKRHKCATAKKGHRPEEAV
jgi:hypothetical protein